MKKLLIAILLLIVTITNVFAYGVMHDIIAFAQRITSQIVDVKQNVETKLQWINELEQMRIEAEQIADYWKQQTSKFDSINWSDWANVLNNSISSLNIATGMLITTDEYLTSLKGVSDEIKNIREKIEKETSFSEDKIAKEELRIYNKNHTANAAIMSYPEYAAAECEAYEKDIEDYKTLINEFRSKKNQAYKDLIKVYEEKIIPCASILSLYEVWSDDRYMRITQDKHINFDVDFGSEYRLNEQDQNDQNYYYKFSDKIKNNKIYFYTGETLDTFNLDWAKQIKPTSKNDYVKMMRKGEGGLNLSAQSAVFNSFISNTEVLGFIGIEKNANKKTEKELSSEDKFKLEQIRTSYAEVKAAARAEYNDYLKAFKDIYSNWNVAMMTIRDYNDQINHFNNRIKSTQEQIRQSQEYLNGVKQ